MRRLKIIPKNAVKLTLKQEIEVTKHIAAIVKANKYKVTTYNICCDHIHFILCCIPDDLELIMKNLKSITSRRFNKIYQIKLWAQKFNRNIIENDDQFERVINYIENNRIKHNLPESEELNIVIKSMLTPIDKG
jgi:REP element-mobilizing transposase RayT